MTDSLRGVALADALYEKPWTYCEQCNGVGQDENCHFWCSACNGEGAVLDEENETSARDTAAGLAEYCLAWFRANRDTLRYDTTPNTGYFINGETFDALLDTATKIGRP